MGLSPLILAVPCSQGLGTEILGRTVPCILHLQADHLFGASFYLAQCLNKDHGGNAVIKRKKVKGGEGEGGTKEEECEKTVSTATDKDWR